MSTAKDLCNLRKEQNICHTQDITAIGEEFREMCEEVKASEACSSGKYITQQMCKAY